MRTASFTAKRIREVFLNGTWVANTNYQDQLSKTSLEEATKKVGELNTIAALSFHVNYYLRGLLNAFEKGKLEISDKYSFDMAPLKRKEDWDTLVSDLLKNAKRFAQYVETLPEERFAEPFIDPQYGSYLRNIEGVIEHSYYHLGQISLIRKMIRSQG